MSDLINKYIADHDAFVDLLVRYYSLHERFLERQSPERTKELRKIYRDMRKALRCMERSSLERMRERRIEWALVNRLPKENKNE